MANRDLLISDCDQKEEIDWVDPSVRRLLVNVIGFLVCLEDLYSFKHLYS